VTKLRVTLPVNTAPFSKEDKQNIEVCMNVNNFTTLGCL